MQRTSRFAVAALAWAATNWAPRAHSQEAAAPTEPAAPPQTVSLPYEQLLERCKALGAPAALVPVGASRAGREIVALRLSNDASAANERPAILVVANVDGSHVWSSSMALRHAEELVRRAAEPEIAALLASTTIYVVPSANPDAHERRFATPRTDREATGVGVDDDRDGRSGEDPQSDVDGDGLITQLRVLDPRGEWIEDPLEPRALVRADRAKGEVGKWRLWTEGRDLDGDERVAEDDPLDACVNRNFAAEWAEHAPASGAFPTDEPETRALCDFVLQRPQIALVVTYGALDNLVEKPKGIAADARTKRVPQAGVVEADVALLGELGKRYVGITGAKAKSRGADAGAWQTWVYAHRGLWSLAIQPWDVPLDTPEAKSEAKSDAPSGEGGDAAGAADKGERKGDKKDKREPSEDAKRLRWIDGNADEAWRFVPWRAFQHPELGACEIGGFAPFARTEPPAAQADEIAAKQLEFLVSLGAELPRVRIAELTAKALGANLFEVEAVIVNPSRLPLMSASGARTGAVKPARLELRLERDAVLAGERIRLVRSLEGSGGRHEERWLVRARSANQIELEVVTPHAGRDAKVAEVKP